jgi:hypothetical protein
MRKVIPRKMGVINEYVILSSLQTEPFSNMGSYTFDGITPRELSFIPGASA